MQTLDMANSTNPTRNQASLQEAVVNGSAENKGCTTADGSQENASSPIPPLELSTAPSHTSQATAFDSMEYHHQSSTISSVSEAKEVYLRVEGVGKTEARILMFGLWLIALFIIFVGIATMASEQNINSNTADYSSNVYYFVVTCVAAVALGILGLFGLKLCQRIYSIRLKKMYCSPRRKAMIIDAGVLLTLTILDLAAWLTAHLLLMSTPRCEMSKSLVVGIGSMSIVRYTCFSLLLTWIIVMVSGMQIYKVKNQLPTINMDPDFLLVMDQPIKKQLRFHLWTALTWLILEIAIIVMFVLTFVYTVKSPADDPNCGTEKCEGNLEEISRIVISCILVLLCIIMFTVSLWKSLRDHKELPYSHYRLTNIYLRLSKRHTSVLLLALVVGVIVVDSAAAGACLGGIDVSMGSITTNIAVFLFAIAAVALYMPSDSNIIPAQALKQEFSWTESQLAAAIRERNSRLLKKKTKSKLLNRVLSGPLYAINLVLPGDVGKAREKAATKPMFCMEFAVRLFYWMRYAYQHGVSGSFFNDETARSFFNLTETHYIHEKETDSKVVLGWNKNTMVISFRGTASMTNVMTDIKAWSTPYQPKSGKSNMLMRVHAGFYDAWMKCGFNKKVLAKVREVIQSSDTVTDMRVFVTGHSLGGSLAILAGLEIKEEHPLVDVICYNFGAPRTGNLAFSNYYAAAVPNTFALVNKEDPIPRIPSIGYHRCGEHVNFNNLTGDMIVNPTYFETSIFRSATGKVTEHKTSNYGMSLMMFIKSQFFLSKRLPGGEEGATQLAQIVDLDTALIATNMDVVSLRDPNIKPIFRKKIEADEGNDDESDVNHIEDE